jgi:hypothetical protein
MLLKRFMKTRYVLSLIIVGVLIGACSSLPAQPPPQLQHTPGPLLVVGERTLQTSAYRIDPPAGWRVVKSTIAAEPIVLVLVAPDDAMMITIGEEPVPAFPDDPNFAQRDAVVTLPNGQSVYMVGQSKRELGDQFDAVFEAVQQSVRLPE